jgi:hypothetical protein
MMEKRVLTKKEQEELRRKKRSNRILERSNKTNSILSQRLEISDSPTDGIMGTPVLSSPREKHILNLKEDEPSSDYLNVDLKLETEMEEKEEIQETEKEIKKKQKQEDEGEKSYKGILWESNEEKVPLIIEEEVEKKKISEKEISPQHPKENSKLNLNLFKLLTLFLISFLLSFDLLKQEYKSPWMLFFLNELSFLTFNVLLDKNIFKNQFSILFFIFKFLFEFFVDFSFFIIFYTTMVEIKKFI